MLKRIKMGPSLRKRKKAASPEESPLNQNTFLGVHYHVSSLFVKSRGSSLARVRDLEISQLPNGDRSSLTRSPHKPTTPG